ncbi:MAG: hypothetical protein ABJ333_04985 [Algoriphagus sp.]|uniref:hypothetical protein n=1 Tax=Algoriphagus sp. TaxID=1872435 RepID=UPI0032747E60
MRQRRRYGPHPLFVGDGVETTHQFPSAPRRKNSALQNQTFETSTAHAPEIPQLLAVDF